MPRNPEDFDIDPGRYQPGDRDEAGRASPRDPDDTDIELDRSVARHFEDAEEAEEAELAEEDILEIADIEEELEARKGG